MPRLIRRTASALRARPGMTLPELIVATFLLALIGGAITRVLLKQSQYYKDFNATTSARRELRLGATVLPAEMRSISTSGGDILAMSESEITMRAAIGSSIICAKSAADVFVVPPTNLSHHTLTSFSSRPVAGDTVFLYDENTKKGSEDDVWRKFGLVTTTLSAVDCIGAPYTDPVLDAPATKLRLVYKVDAAIQDSVKLGAVVRFTRPVRYKIYQEASGSWYLGLQEWKSGSWQATDPLAGPYRPFAAGDANPSGLQFRYYDTLGVRITNYANTKDVGRIDVFLRTNAGKAAVTERKGADLRDSVVMRVAIRNSK